MKNLNNKRWVLALITGASLLVSLAGVTQALPQTQRVQPVYSPLSPNDPAAKLDPSLVNAPVIPERKADTSQSFPLSPDDPAAKLNPNLVNALTMPERKTDTSQTFPLPPTHPDAKLDPRLVNAPVIPERTVDNTSASDRISSPATEIGYDVRTGSTQVGTSQPVRRSGTTTQSSPPNTGANSKISPEPRHSDSK